MLRKAIFVLGFLGAASAVLASPVLQTVPVVAGKTSSEVRAITPDGRWVVGNSGDSGLLWDTVTAPANSLATVAGGFMKNATGVAYRGSNVAVLGLQNYGNPAGGSYNNTPTIGTYDTSTGVWAKTWRDGANYQNSILGAANTLASQSGVDVMFASFQKTSQSLTVAKFTNGAAPAVDNKSTGTTATANGVSNQGLVAGSRGGGIYYNQWLGNGTGSVAFVNGLNGTTAGEGYVAVGNKTTGKIFGRAPITVGGADLYPYMHDLATGLTTQLDMFGDEAGSTSLSAVYGASEDGRYVAGMLYRGQEKAVLWDTQLGTVTDLTQFAADNGILGSFTGNLRRAYTVGVNALGQPVVGGMGVTDTLATRGFVLTIPEPSCLAFLALGGLALLRRRR